MPAKEAQARIKINKLLEESGWRFFDHPSGKASIVLEPKVTLTKAAIVAEIEAEHALVTANRELIARFEKKIQTTLARVWGEA